MLGDFLKIYRLLYRKETGSCILSALSYSNVVGFVGIHYGYGKNEI